ncbi:matrix metalloproteinase-14-like isoform X1 [Ptychodera flava]|uniref:matrix metalloproteinase-14-like isoform X1 n=1 Tax=Ptychodera flava TaxID=63121 RepID=UPI00396A6F13
MADHRQQSVISILLCLYLSSFVTADSSVARGVDYLMRFGYLKTPDLASGQLQTQEEFENAVRTMQRFANLPETGELDADTLAQMQKPRCGLPDIVGTSESARKRRYALVNSKWDKNHLTYRIENFTPDLNPEQTRTTIRKAFDVWQDVTPLVFTEIFQGIADIRIQFRRGYHQDAAPFDGPGGTLAHAYFPGQGIGGDCHFDDDEPFTIDTYEGIDLFQVAAHEFGHSLGLGHSSVPGALMAPYYQGYRPNFELPEDDRIGIQTLYGAPSGVTSKPEMPEITEEATEAVDPVKPTMEPCTAGFDAIGMIRNELFVFKDDMFWRIRTKGQALSGYPIDIKRFWYDLPYSIDAAYERHDYRIIFLKDSQYWTYRSNYPEASSPQYLSNLGLPRNIDAALVWGQNGKTFFFRGKKYWRYDEYNERVDPGYPKLISENWVGIPNDIDAAFEWTDGFTYFFKGDKYWQFDSAKMSVVPGYPRNAATDWLGCRSLNQEKPEDDTNEIEEDYLSSAPVLKMTSVLVLTAATLAVFL